jgi:outer membrane protein OmpA-like peptidoglycan-associated protein
MKPARTTIQADAASSANRSARSRSRSRPDVIGNQTLQQHLGRGARVPFTVGARNDASEHEASQAAASFTPGARPRDQAAPPATAGMSARTGPGTLASAMGEAGAPLDRTVRADMEAHFGVPLGDVRVHTGPRADQLAQSLGARAFTHGRDIVFGEGRRPGADALTAHELAHVVQQTGGSAGAARELRLSPRSEPRLLQCSLGPARYAVPYGDFDVTLETKNAAPPAWAGVLATISFIPGQDAPNSNYIAFIQIVRLVDTGGADVSPWSLLPANPQAPRGPLLPSHGLRTADDPLRGVEGGFYTDVEHQPSTPPGQPTPAPAARGSFKWPRFPTGPGLAPQTPGFKRSNDPADIRSAAMYDTPGTGGAADFSFESVALGEDKMITYGAVNWGFGVRNGTVVNEHLNVVPGHSATFEEALERHRDFYVHEPVIFYFEFNSAELTEIEKGKIDTFTAYLDRNPDIHMEVSGYADIMGGESAYNINLSGRRADAVWNELVKRGIPQETIMRAHVADAPIGFGASSKATNNAGTGDQGGDRAVGADQMREANRWANRRVILTFRHATETAP